MKATTRGQARRTDGPKRAWADRGLRGCRAIGFGLAVVGTYIGIVGLLLWPVLDASRQAFA